MAEKTGKGINWNQAERAGQGIGDYIIGTRDADNVTNEFEDVGNMARLFGGQRRRGTEKSMGKRLMIDEQGKNSGFKEKTEMADGGVSCKEFMIKGGVFGLGRG